MYFMVHPRYIYDVIAKYIVVITILCKSLWCINKPRAVVKFQIHYSPF